MFMKVEVSSIFKEKKLNQHKWDSNQSIGFAVYYLNHQTTEDSLLMKGLIWSYIQYRLQELQYLHAYNYVQYGRFTDKIHACKILQEQFHEA